jgi:hypothetical protein
MITVAAANSEMTRSTPFSDFATQSTVRGKLWNPFPVTTRQYKCSIRPGVIVRSNFIALVKFMNEHIAGKSFTISQEQIISGQVGF